MKKLFFFTFTFTFLTFTFCAKAQSIENIRKLIEIDTRYSTKLVSSADTLDFDRKSIYIICRLDDSGFVKHITLSPPQREIEEGYGKTWHKMEKNLNKNLNKKSHVEQQFWLLQDIRETFEKNKIFNGQRPMWAKIIVLILLIVLIYFFYKKQ